MSPPTTGTPLPRGRSAASPEDVAHSQRSRLLAAMKTLAARDGYNAVTISALVRQARVAKPTFYERFEDKEDCFLQLFDELWENMLAGIVTRIPDGSTVFERIDIGLDAFLESLAADPDTARILLIESLRAGDAAAARLGAAHETFATIYRESREELRQQQKHLPAISTTRALAVVGAVNEPVVAAVRAGSAADLLEIREELRAVVHSLAFATP